MAGRGHWRRRHRCTGCNRCRLGWSAHRNCRGNHGTAGDRSGDYRRCFSGGRSDTDHLSHFNAVRILQGIPARNILVALASLQADADQGVTRLDGVVPGLARILEPGQLPCDLGTCIRAGRRANGVTPVFHRRTIERLGSTSHQQECSTNCQQTGTTTQQTRHKHFPSGNARF